MSPKLKKFIASWVVNTLAVAFVSFIMPGIHYDRFLDLVIASLLLGILNPFVRALLKYFASPLLLFTLGLFMFVMNVLLLYLMGVILKGFHVDSFWAAFLGALIIGVVSTAWNILTTLRDFQVAIQRGQRPPPPRDSGPGGNGPVIDV